MNKSIKIILLAFALFMAVSAVMVFYRNIVAPPGKLDNKNQYIAEAKKEIEQVERVNDDCTLNGKFNQTIHEVSFLRKNKLITDSEHDKLLGDFTGKYVPEFVKVCNAEFARTAWNDGKIANMSSSINQLLSLKLSSGKAAVSGSPAEGLGGVKTTITKYGEAKNAAAASGYNGLQSARQRIATARAYAQLPPLNNNAALVSQLLAVPARLGQAHFAYLTSQVGALAAYRSYSESSYYNLLQSVRNKIAEYQNNAANVYDGQVSNVGGLLSRVSSYEAAARQYYYENSYDSYEDYGGDYGDYGDDDYYEY